jgi:uncharacterized protein (TIGR02679 family)
MIEEDGRLQRLLGGDSLSSLRKRLRQRFERGPADGKLERLRIANLGMDEHAALAGLMGRSVRFSSSLQIDVPLIDAALSRAGIATSLREALELIDGPIVHTETARAELQAGWSNVISIASHADFSAFLHAPSGVGLLKRLSNNNPEAAIQLCFCVDTVLKALPANGIARAQLAAKTLGDAHALDNGRAVAALVIAVWRKKTVPEHIAQDDAPLTVESEIGDERIRDVWAKAGVLVNELARPALFLNLHINGRSILPIDSGEPTYASLRFLLRSNPSWDVSERDVYVCENANFLAIAADQLGAHCAPMVCTDGMPAAAQRVMLRQLAAAGGRLRYHGDFDWAGVRIGNFIMRECGARPWRFDAGEYLAAVAQAPLPGLALAGPEANASWDEALTVAMREHQLSIAEESLADVLLQDLTLGNP